MEEQEKTEKKEKKVFHKRKKLNLRVKQDFQMWLLVRILGTSILTVAVASVLMYMYSKGVIDAQYLAFKPDTARVSDVLLPILIGAALTSIVAGLLLALFLPQKIAGPIFRIEQDLLKIREGDLTKKVNLRCHDILKELSESVNMTVADIGSMVKDIKKSGIDLEEKIAAGDAGEIRRAQEELKSRINRIKTSE